MTTKIEDRDVYCDLWSALSRISPRVRVRDSVSIVYRIALGGYSLIWPCGLLAVRMYSDLRDSDQKTAPAQVHGFLGRQGRI